MKLYIASLLVALGIVGGYVFPLEETPVLPVVGQALPATPAGFETTLASPISSSATSLTLTANALRGGTAVSGFTCLTIDEGSAQREDVCGTLSGTSMTGITRGIDPATGTSTVSALQFAHRRGANVKITDFPVITILRNQNNGLEAFENRLRYAITVKDSDLTSATTSLVSYNLLANSLAAGTVDGSTIVKGVFEGATALEAGSSTVVGATGANLVMLTANATDTPMVGCATGYTSTAGAGCSVIATLSGKIRQTFLDIFSTANTWTLFQRYSGGFLSTASSTTYSLAIGDSIAATTTDNLVVENNASTTNLTVSRSTVFTQGSTMTGWASSTGYELITSTSANGGPNTTGSEVTLSVNCSNIYNKVAIGGGGAASSDESEPWMADNYPSATSTWSVTWVASGNSTPNDISAYVICVNK